MSHRMSECLSTNWMSDIMSELTSHQMSHPTETSAGLPRPGGEAHHDRLLRSDWDCISYQISFKDLDEDIWYMSFGFVWTWATPKLDSLDIGFFINMVIWYIQFSVRPIFVSAQRTFSLDVLSCKVLLTSGRFLVRTWAVGTVGVYQMCSTLPWSKRLLFCHLYILI